MAKLQSASVRLVLKKNRQNDSGENPIYVVVSWYGKKEKSTGVFINERFWNASKEEIRKTCPNSIVLNRMINDLKQRIIDKRNRYETEGKTYTPSILLEDDSVPILSKRYHTLTDNYVADRNLSFNSAKGYKYNLSKLDAFFGRNDYIVDELTTGVIKRFIDSLPIADHTKRGVLGRIASIWNYAIEKKLCSQDDYPFKDFVYTKRYKQSNRTYYLDSGNLKKLKSWFFSRCLNVKGELYSYKDGIEDKLMNRSSIEFAALFFLMLFRTNGSAPIDLAKLKVSNCSRVTVNNEDYWKLKFTRTKTGIPVTVLLKRDILTMVGFEHYLHTAHLRNGMIYPVLKDGLTQHERVNSMNKFCLYCNRNLKDIARVINQKTVETNVKNNANEQLIDVDNFTMYVARHTKANDYLSHPDANLHALATLMGRSVGTLGVYVHQIQSDKDLAIAEDMSTI